MLSIALSGTLWCWWKLSGGERFFAPIAGDFTFTRYIPDKGEKGRENRTELWDYLLKVVKWSIEISQSVRIFTASPNATWLLTRRGLLNRESESFRQKMREPNASHRVALDLKANGFIRESYEVFSGKPQTLAPVADIRKALKKFSSGPPVNQPVAWFSI